MRLLNRIEVVICGLMLAGVTVCKAQAPIENLRVRLECYPSGKVKTEVFAKQAVVATDGTITATGVVFKQFTVEGKLDIKVEADNCVINQEAQTASSTHHVVLHRGGIVVSGGGFNWNGNDGKIVITKEAKVELPMAVIKTEGVFKNARKK